MTHQPHRQHHVSAIEEPTPDNLVEVTQQLKEAVETYGRMRDPEGDEGIPVLHELRDGGLTEPGGNIDIHYSSLKLGPYFSIREAAGSMTAAASPTPAVWPFTSITPDEDSEMNWNDAAGRYVVNQDGWYTTNMVVVLEPLGTPIGTSYIYYGDIRVNGVSVTGVPVQQTAADGDYTTVTHTVATRYLRRTDYIEYFTSLTSSVSDTYDVGITWDVIRIPGQ